MTTTVKTRAGAEARRIVLGGRVQGLGVRPSIFRLATELKLGGSVRNTARGVEIEVEGPAHLLQRFEHLLPTRLPSAAFVARLECESTAPLGCGQFTIVKESAIGPPAARVPEDRAVCDACLAEIAEPADRRHSYPFTSCTHCGPRYSVIRAMPYEREDTAMADFPLCLTCEGEYLRPGDRRFHAQTTACPNCGPQAWLTDGVAASWLGVEAVREAAMRIVAGQIVAVRGLGGYQLMVDATNESAVLRLRERKGRRAKPLAVMVDSLATAERLAYFDEEERRAFEDFSAPIVLVRAKSGGKLTEAIHPHLDTVGLMRPTTPLHAILIRLMARPLVCTSGNREGDPLEYEVESAEKRLAGIADAWLHHNRPIVRPIDDSVVRIIAGRRVTIRLARGLAPLALPLAPMPPLLAVGGFFKSAAAWSNGVQAVLGPHIGDQETIASRERFIAQLQDWKQLYRFQPAQLAYDLHPDYFSTQWAQRQLCGQMVVQHHHAHVVAGMLEHGWLDRRVLGVAWDGTGYGTDGTIWGGEFLLATATQFERIARLRPFRLPGGEWAIREPWRTAVSVCQQVDAGTDFLQWPNWDVPPDRVTALRQLIDRRLLSPMTSSAGRLFDAAAAIILGLDCADFEGQAARRLEAAADHREMGCYPAPIDVALTPYELDWRSMFVQILADVQHGVRPGRMAMRFHRGLARGIVDVCRLRPELPIVLSGGVFQNRLLTELVTELMHDEPQPLGLPGLIPPNDGGLAAGQLAIAAARGGYLPCA